MVNPRVSIGKTNTVGFAKSDNMREGSKSSCVDGCARTALSRRIYLRVLGVHVVSPRGYGRVGRRSVNPTGIKILGTPVGSEEFHLVCTRERLAEEAVLWRAIPWVQDLQCAWQPTVQPFRAFPAFQHRTRKAMTGGCRRLCEPTESSKPVDIAHANGRTVSFRGFMGRRTSHDPPASPPPTPSFIRWRMEEQMVVWVN